MQQCNWLDLETLGSNVQNRSLQCPSNAIWPFKIFPSQNNPSKRNPKLKNEDIT